MFKKSALAALVAASLVPATGLADNVVYGQARVFYGSETKANDSAIVMASEASRIGFKGNAKLDNGLKAIYKFEYQVDPTSNATLKNAVGTQSVSIGGIVKNRNNYVGLKGGFGQVIFGTHDTPLKKSQGKVDLFSDYYNADMKKALSTSKTTGSITITKHGEDRVGNMVYYKTPSIAGGLNFHVGLIPGEQHGNDDLSGPADIISVAATYKADQFHVGVANNSFKDYSLTRVSGQFNADAFGIGALVQMSEDKTSGAKVEEQGTLVSGYFKATDALKIKLQHVMSEVKDSEKPLAQTTAGLDYKMGKYTTGTFYVTDRKQKDVESKDYQFTGIGLIHKF